MDRLKMVRSPVLMTTLVLSGTGKTGRRIVQRLTERHLPVRVGSRSAPTPFDWDDPATWGPALRGVTAVYVAYPPDLALPSAAPAVEALTAEAVGNGTQRLVLLSGRGEPDCLPAEQAVRDSGVDWTILRSSWFSQNFSEAFLLDAVLSGQIVLPTGDVPEPFVDAEDLADAAAAALTTSGHSGQVYELTGPRLLTFGQAAEEISTATGRSIRYIPVTPSEFAASLPLDAELVTFLTDLFTRVLDGRNAHLTDDLEKATGREPTDFTEYAKRVAATGIWG